MYPIGIQEMTISIYHLLMCKEKNWDGYSILGKKGKKAFKKTPLKNFINLKVSLRIKGKKQN